MVLGGQNNVGIIFGVVNAHYQNNWYQAFFVQIWLRFGKIGWKKGITAENRNNRQNMERKSPFDPFSGTNC